MTKATDPPARYPIRAVSKMTGIAIDTLRAWERRYGAVTPSRDDRGRMYSDADVARLRLLRGAVDQGHSIGRLVGLDDDQLRDLLATSAGLPPIASAGGRAVDTGPLVAALSQFDAVGIDQEMARLASVLRPLDLLQRVLMPALVTVGDDWHRGHVSVAHEHLMSSAIRHLLGSFLRLHARRDVPARLVFATASGDRHEIGILGAAMLAATSGLGVAYLGPDLPAREMVTSVTPAGAQVLVLGLTMTSNGRATERELRTIVRDLPKGVELWAGGLGAEQHSAILTPRGLVFHDFDGYQQALVRIGGRMQ